jgi:glycosyltransferase involved in cell wall biosynthesis
LNPPYLSVIIPARNEESRLPRALGQVFAFLEKQNYSSEVVVVENGSSDRTLAVAQEYAFHFNNLRILHEDLPGKGRAIQHGVLKATGSYRFIADADFSMPVEEINRFLPPASNFDISIASRKASDAIRFNEPLYRHFTGRVFNYLIRLLALPGLKDTQCGFKCFKSTVADDIFHYQTLTGWSFDVELLVIARSRGYSITEIGIPWTYTPGSKVNVIRDSGRMFVDLLTIRRNLSHGVYNPR